MLSHVVKFKLCFREIGTNVVKLLNMLQDTRSHISLLRKFSKRAFPRNSMITVKRTIILAKISEVNWRNWLNVDH